MNKKWWPINEYWLGGWSSGGQTVYIPIMGIPLTIDGNPGF